jgi:hypothetical protein
MKLLLGLTPCKSFFKNALTGSGAFCGRAKKFQTPNLPAI